MKKLVFILSLSFCFVCPWVSFGQTISLTNDTACIGDTLYVSVHVTSFDSVAAISLNYDFDTSSLEYIDVVNIHPSLNTLLSNLLLHPQPRIKTAWYSSTSGFVNLGDTILYDLKFAYKGDSSSINFLANSEISDNNYNPHSVSYSNAFIDQKQTPVIYSNPGGDTVCAFGSTYFTVSAGNVVSYQWQRSINGGISWIDLSNSSLFSGVTTDSLQISSALPNFNTNLFRCRVFNECSVISDAATLVVSHPLVEAGTNDTICKGNSIGLNAGITGGFPSYTYSWSTGDSLMNISVSPAVSTTYYFSVSDSYNCSHIDSVQILVSDPFVNAGTDDTLCIGQSIAIQPGYGGGFMPYSFNWNTGDTTAGIIKSPASASLYVLTITDANLCLASDSITVFVSNPQADAGTDDSICIGSSVVLTGSISGGYPSYSYFWSNGAASSSASVSPTVSTTYYLSVTDSKSCSHTDSVHITVSDPVVDAGANDTICYGNSVNLVATSSGGIGSYNYSWSNGVNSQTQIVSPAGDSLFKVSLTDMLGCTAADSLYVFVSNPQVTCSSDDSICFGDSASISVSVSGGYPGYSYAWNNGSILAGQLVSPATTFTYKATVTDAIGCLDSANTTITLSQLTVDAGMDDSLCLGSSVNLMAIINGGFGPYAYTWNNGDTGSQIVVSPVSDSIYAVFVSDILQCFDTDTVKVLVSDPFVNIGADDTICEGDSISLTAQLTGGFSPYSFLWNTQDTTQTIHYHPLTDTSYHITVSDRLGCSSSDSMEVTVNPEPFLELGNDTMICVYHSVILDAGAAVMYEWSTGDTTQTIVVDSAGTGIGTIPINVVITDSNGCQNRDTILISFDPCMGIAETKDDIDIRIHPNPANNFLKVEISGKLPLLLDIFTPEGEWVYRKEIRQKNTHIQTGELPVGLYFIRLTGIEYSVQKKLLINR